MLINRRKTNWNYIIVFGLIGLVLFLGNSFLPLGTFRQSVCQVVCPITQPIAQVFTSVDSFVSLITQLQSLQVENADLHDRIAQLESNNQQFETLKTENTWLRSQLQLSPVKSSKFSSAQVLRYQYVPVPGVVFVQTDITVKVGDLLANYNYLLGKVDEVVSPGIAKVVLWQSPGFAVPVEIGSKGAVGEMEADSTGELSIKNVDAKYAVAVGDRIKLLNPSGLFVSKYIIGTVSKVAKLQAGTTQELTVKAAVDPYGFTNAVIIPNQPET